MRMDWEKRIEKLNENVFRESEEYVKGIRKIYDFEVNKIQDKIYNHLTKLQAEAGGISLFEAKKMLNDKELSLFKMDLDEFMKKSKGSITPEIERELDIISHRVRISKLQAMELELKKTVANLMSKEDKGLFNHLGKTYEKRYYNELYELHRIVGYSNFQSIDKGTLKTILKTPWTSDGNEFSNRIWERGNKLVNSLKDNLTRDIIRGTSPDESIKNIAKEFETSKYNAVRLVMTETAAINSKAVQDSYKKLGVEKYEIIATLDLKTSQICRDMDGRVFEYKDYKIGITAPPFHPNCRTTTVPYFDDIDDETRMIRNPETGKSERIEKLSYGEWYEKYVDVSSEKEYTNNKQMFGSGFETIIFKKYSEFVEFYGQDKLDEFEWSVNAEEAESIAYYSHRGDETINSILRSGKIKGEIERHIRNIDNVISNFDLPDKISVYRGSDLDFLYKKFETSNIQEFIGKSYIDKGYVSTSIILEKAFCEKEAMFEIYVPKGKGIGAMISSFSNHFDEYEFLLKRDLEFKILDVKEMGLIVNNRTMPLLIMEVKNV
ncbi:phage putative head morphogenesis protein, SPP1 gp7 family [Peptoniphilus asaccharolyticus DSM 20463]|uniref:Phage putative head morphogenesis protein, SPP1 gp7 family n=2 Tax=Peptoniphilus asaccharolyticus TaxID=1258 RepID=A0A1W1V2B5_PEPAS|nr:phage putative head morphogenesis protein, SPP1 gp7 family [Peptoniphilus asaccharolyticus DSM 20463]